MKKEKPTVMGTSSVNHSARCNLGVDCRLYIFVSFVEKMYHDVKPVNHENAYQLLGFSEYDVIELINEALSQELIETARTVSNFKPSKRWIEAHVSTDVEFEEFWAPMVIDVEGEKKKIMWTGSKHDAKQKFSKVRKLEAFDYLLKQKEAYFKMIAASDWRRIMGCSVFLNLDKKRYSENWGEEESSTEKAAPQSKKALVNIKSQF